MKSTDDERDLLLKLFEKSYEQADLVLRRELGRTPTGAEITQRIIRAVDYTCRCRDAVDRGEIGKEDDDRGLLAEADRHAQECSQTEDFKHLSALLSKWLGDAGSSGTTSAKNGGRDE